LKVFTVAYGTLDTRIWPRRNRRTFKYCCYELYKI